MKVGKRHRRAPQLGRLFALMSVIALACACFPALAQAECTSSSCIQYTENIPKAEGGNGPTPHGQKTPAKASKTGGGAGGSDARPHDSGEADGSEGESSEKEDAVAGGGGGKGQGKPDAGAQGGAKNAVHPGDQGNSPAQTSKSGGGGSSPLVPILIAIAVLAAISVAVVMARQRRQRRGPTGTASAEAN